ncbi:cytochrome P450 [Streptosporangiaceae bacterium NEAU-GS5]|nr:cytochrome P450 [Streptosporangiaceae bacterium NEAU-GS5]
MTARIAARVTELRMRVFARVNGPDGYAVPPALFRRLYEHPAASGRSRGAALSDLFWYWLSPGAHVHQEHLEPGERYDEVARATRRFLSLPSAEITELAARCAAQACDRVQAPALVRLRDLLMPVWAEFWYEVAFGERCPPQARALIIGHADDVVTALKCDGLRHMGRRRKLTRYLQSRLADTRVALPEGLTDLERAWYLQGTFFNTGVVQMSEASAHLLMALAENPGYTLDQNFLDETFRMYPLFGVAHRITAAGIDVPGHPPIPAGTVLCFNYPVFHRTDFDEPDRFDPARWDGVAARQANHVPFGVAANRPCPAWRLAPIALRAVAEQVLSRFDPHTTAAHTRALANRGPCLLVPRGERPSQAALAWLRVRDGWEDVGRSVKQLFLGAYMVWRARRLRLCERHFSEMDAK